MTYTKVSEKTFTCSDVEDLDLGLLNMTVKWLGLYLSVHSTGYPSIHMSISLSSLFIYSLITYHLISLSACLYICQFVILSVVCMSLMCQYFSVFDKFEYPSLCLTIILSIHLSIYPSIYLYSCTVQLI